MNYQTIVLDVKSAAHPTHVDVVEIRLALDCHFEQNKGALFSLVRGPINVIRAGTACARTHKDWKAAVALGATDLGWEAWSKL